MKKLLITFFTVLFCLTSSVGWSLEYKDLVKRDGFYYKKFSNILFSGKVDGQFNGSIKYGEREGDWVVYWNNGQLFFEGNYKNGKKEGSWITYYNNGILQEKSTYQDGKIEGFYKRYYDNGKLTYKGFYKNDKRVGFWWSHWDNGVDWFIGIYKNGKREGKWVQYDTIGSLDKEETGTYKDGIKISD